MMPGSSSDSRGKKSRPLLEPAFLSELERLAATPRRASLATRKEARRSVRKARPGSAPESSSGDTSRSENRGNRRMARLFRRVLQEGRPTLYIFIDSTESMEMRSQATGRRKWDQACSIAAAVAIAARSRFQHVHLVTLGHSFGGRSPVVGSESDRGTLILGALQRTRPGGKATLLTVLDRYLRRAPKRGVALVVSDLLSAEWDAALEGFAESGMHVALLQILDPSDLTTRTPLSLSLREPSEQAGHPLTVSPLIVEGLRDSVTDYCAEIAAICRQTGMDYARTDTDEPFETELIAALSENP